MVIDLSKILSKYKKGWLALTPNNKKLVAVGTTLKDVLAKARKKGVENPTVFKAAPMRNYFSG